MAKMGGMFTKIHF